MASLEIPATLQTAKSYKYNQTCCQKSLGNCKTRNNGRLKVRSRKLYAESTQGLPSRQRVKRFAYSYSIARNPTAYLGQCPVSCDERLYGGVQDTSKSAVHRA